MIAIERLRTIPVIGGLPAIFRRRSLQKRIGRYAASVQLFPSFADADCLAFVRSGSSPKLSIHQPERLREEHAQQRARKKLGTAETLACEKVTHYGKSSVLPQRSQFRVIS